MCTAGWCKHCTRRRQGWNCSENRFCRRTRGNSRELYSIKEHLSGSRKSNEHFPFGLDSNRSQWCVFSGGPFVRVEQRDGETCWGTLHGSDPSPSHDPLQWTEIIPWRRSIADQIAGKRCHWVWEISALSFLHGKHWHKQRAIKRDTERRGRSTSNQESASHPTQLDLTLKSNEFWLA